MTANPHEERARRVKAFRLAVVMLRLCRQYPAYKVEDFRDATPEARRLTAAAAQVREPSDETWRQAVEQAQVIENVASGR